MSAAAEPISIRKLWTTPGGVHPSDNKIQSLELPLEDIAPPPEVLLPLNQHLGAPAEPAVKVGDKVLKGQIVAHAKGNVSANVHASISGTVTAIESHPIAHPSGMSDTCIVIENDFQNALAELIPCANYRQLHGIEIIDRISAAGIVGMGGAGFPTAIKLQPQQAIDTLIINGTECEPYITADDILMRTDSAKILDAIGLVDFLLEQPADILIAIEDNKPEAIAIMQQAVAEHGNERIEVVALPTKYPSGGEKQLIQSLTGKEVSSGTLPAQLGIVCQNIATVVAAYHAVVVGEPLISRIVTMSGNALGKQQNLRIPIGTPIDFILQQQELQQDKLSRLVMGGPMMGFTLSDTQVPVVKTTNCILALDFEESPPPQPAMACIRCGMCAEACPASLLPQQLYWYAKAQDHDKLSSYHLFDCIECGACSYACPSRIPLVQYYRAAKAEIRHADIEKRHSDRARQRFEFHKERVEAEKEARAEAKRIAAEKAKERAKHKKKAPPITPPTGEDDGNEQARLQRNLASTEDRIKKFQDKLAELEQSAPTQIPALQAKIKEAELKRQTILEKLATLATPTDKAVIDENVKAKPESDSKAEDKKVDAGALPEANAPADVVPIKDSSAQTTTTSFDQFAQWQLQLQDIQSKIEQCDNDDNDTLAALKLSKQILSKKIHDANIDNEKEPESKSEATTEGIDPIQRAMENAMAKDNDTESP